MLVTLAIFLALLFGLLTPVLLQLATLLRIAPLQAVAVLAQALGLTGSPTFALLQFAFLEGLDALASFEIDLLPDPLMQILEIAIEACRAENGGNRGQKPWFTLS